MQADRQRECAGPRQSSSVVTVAVLSCVTYF